MSDERYPIGSFKPKDSYSKEEIKSLIAEIASLPSRLEKEIAGFTTDQFDTPYREGGWTVRQLIHHVADSHLNSYIRIKWTLTEDKPVIKAYDEKSWAMTAENNLDPTLSLTLLKALHAKWTALLGLLSDSDLAKEFIHPETKKSIRLDRTIALYAWHGNHHLAHITSLKGRKQWK